MSGLLECEINFDHFQMSVSEARNEHKNVNLKNKNPITSWPFEPNPIRQQLSKQISGVQTPKSNKTHYSTCNKQPIN